LKPNLRISVQTLTLLDAGKSQREISRVLGVDRKTLHRIAREGLCNDSCAFLTFDSVVGEWASDANQPCDWGFRMPLTEPGVRLSIRTGLSLDVHA
jgi:hypothetical protein